MFGMGLMKVVFYILLLSWLNIACVKVSFFRNHWQAHYKSMVKTFAKILKFFYEQLFDKQLAFGCQIAKRLSGLNPLLLSNNKNCRLQGFIQALTDLYLPEVKTQS